MFTDPITIVLGISFIGLLFAGYLTWYVLRQDTGTDQMREISDAIKEGAGAFLKRQYTTIIGLSALTAALLYGIFHLIGHGEEAHLVTIAFVFGAICSAIAGFVGMWVAVRTNIRTASAVRSSIGKATVIALRGGGVTGMIVMALSLVGVAALYLLFGAEPELTPFQIVGYGFGASFVALFAQLGGGIYTKAADMGADLVGKVEAGIPEDDPRNPAVIADLVGDNVGDCAGRGADLFESTAAENIGAMILGIALFQTFGVNGVLFPLVVISLGILSSIVGILFVRDVKEDQDPMAVLYRGFLVTTLISVGLFYWAVKTFLTAPGVDSMYFFYAGLVGMALSVVFFKITEYYTAYGRRPVDSIADASVSGPAMNIVTGLSVGFEATALPVLFIALGLGGSYWLGLQTGLAGGGLYGTAVATMGMLSTAAYILAMDTFGPIADNAGGIVEMSDVEDVARERNDKLDAVGNTTKALTKGYAIGSAALAAFLLFSAYLVEVKKFAADKGPETLAALSSLIDDRIVDIAKIDVFIGALLGAMLIFLFAGVGLTAVNKAAQYIIQEVRRQFKEDPGILKGTSKPDYARCVDICTQGALKEMVLPGALIVVVPAVTGMILGAEAMAAFLMVGTIAGILVALMMNTGGAAWDNAKKYIETGVHGGKGTDAHAASVIGDTIGDPFKDTVGPSLHVVIKLLNTLTLVLVPLFLLTV